MGKGPWSIIRLIKSTIRPDSAFAHHPGIGASESGGCIFAVGAAPLKHEQFAISIFSIDLRSNQASELTLVADSTGGIHALKAADSRAFALAYCFIEDVTLLGRYRLMNRRSTGTQGVALLRVKLPTSTTDAVGSPFETEFQPVSNSWDALFGALFSRNLALFSSLHANTLAIATDAGTLDSNLGNRLLYHIVLDIASSAASAPADTDARVALDITFPDRAAARRNALGPLLEQCPSPPPVKAPHCVNQAVH